MVKVASVREIRQYGRGLARNRSEFINSALYVFATVLLLCGFVALLVNKPKPGLVLLLVALALIIMVNVHDLFSHLAGIDYRLWFLGLDPQLALVEVFVPVVQAVGALLSFLGIMFLFIEAKKDHVDIKLEKHALNLLVAGSALWLLGSVHNSFQIYEIIGGYTQVLQASVYIPFLIGSLLFFLGAVINIHDQQQQATLMHHGLGLLGKSWAWFGFFGSLMLSIGGLANLVKVLKMQDGIQLEKLRGGAQDRLVQEREGRIPDRLVQEIEGRPGSPRSVKEKRWRRMRTEKEREIGSGANRFKECGL